MPLQYYKKTKLPPCYTEEFRDPEVWEELKERLANSVERLGYNQDGNSLNPPKNPLWIFRAWSAGCATGEEAYSLAHTLGEVFERKRVYWRVYGTDIEQAFSAERLGYKYNQDKKLLNAKPFTLYADRIRFRHHDLVKDEPFKYMSLVLCRNVLMFFKPEYQEIICQKLYESLRTGGFLVLGKAEYLRGDVTDKFKVINKKLRIFQKI